MYRKILVALDNSRADRTLIPHVSELARLHRSQLLLVHVADGFAARNFEQLNLRESEEMKNDRAYLENEADKLRNDGLAVQTVLELGDPARQIVKTAAAENCDLIAMTSHGHRLIGDILHGSTINEVRHQTDIPLLLVRAAKS